MKEEMDEQQRAGGSRAPRGLRFPTAPVPDRPELSAPRSLPSSSSFPDCPLLHPQWLSSSTLEPAWHQATSSVFLRGVLMQDTTFRYLKPICTCLHKFNCARQKWAEPPASCVVITSPWEITSPPPPHFYQTLCRVPRDTTRFLLNNFQAS